MSKKDLMSEIEDKIVRLGAKITEAKQLGLMNDQQIQAEEAILEQFKTRYSELKAEVDKFDRVDQPLGAWSQVSYEGKL